MKKFHATLRKNSTSLVGICVILFAVIFLGPVTQTVSAVVPRDTSVTNAHVDKCKKTFFGLVPWYYYMDQEFQSDYKYGGSACDIKCFNLFNQSEYNECGQLHSDVPAVLLAVIDDLLRIAGMVAVAFVFVGAFQYTTSSGNPEQTAKARSTLINALAGLAVALVSVAFVSFIGNRLAG